ncbi:MAG: AI-2E family transporter [Patescibacteria group bacterium]
MNGRGQPVTFSTASFIKLILVVIALLFLYYVRDVIIMIFVSVVLASALAPWVDKLQKRNIPRVLSIVIFYVIILGLISVAIALIIPAISSQLKQFAGNFPSLYEKIQNSLPGAAGSGSELVKTIQESLQSIVSTLGDITSSIFAGLSGLFGGLFSLVGILVLTFYIVLIEDGFRKVIAAISPAKYQPYFVLLISRIQTRLGFWIKGQLILCVVIGTVCFIGLVILQVPYPLVLGLIAGITEFIPIAGPIIGAVPAVLIALTVSPWKAIFVVILYILIQQLENNLLVPKVMQKVTGLNPIVVIIVMLLASKLLGILGIILAIPITIIGDEFLKDFFKEKREKEDRIEGEGIG